MIYIKLEYRNDFILICLTFVPYWPLNLIRKSYYVLFYISLALSPRFKTVNMLIKTMTISSVSYIAENM